MAERLNFQLNFIAIIKNTIYICEKRTLTSELMNIHRNITALLLLFGCIISLSAAAVLYA